MKLNITIQPYELSGYKNISPLTGSNVLDLPVEQAECTEIIAEDIIDYILYDKIQEVVSGYVSKLRHGGRIILGGTDVFEVSKQCLTQATPVQKINTILYGDGNPSGWGFKRSCTTIIHITSILSQLGLKITKQRLEETKFIVEAYRA
jgi:hypothetical protein